MNFKIALVSVSLVSLTIVTMPGAEKDGLRVEVVPKVLVEKSAIANSATFSTPVNQEMSLKATFKNISMKDDPEGSIEYIVLVHRWSTETGTYSSYSGIQKLEPLKFGQQVEVDIGRYHLGGHLHGVSDRHKDSLGGWKIVVTEGAKKVEFSFPANFDALNKTATASR